VEEAFSPKILAANLKLFKDQLEVIFAFYALCSKLKNWENVPATIFTILVGISDICVANDHSLTTSSPPNSSY
jgi:hypothetical protein